MKTRIIPKIGDIVEIKTPKGLAYVQYTAKHTAPPVFGELIRVLPGLYESPPVDLSALAKEKEKYFVFTPITFACRKKWATIVSNEAIPAWVQGVPVMRMANRIGAHGKGRDWYLWDGVDASPANNADIKEFSIAEILGHDILVDRLAERWLPSDDYTSDDRLSEVSGHFEALDTHETPTELTRSLASEPALAQVRHYLYFPSKALADAAGKTLKTQGYSVNIEPDPSAEQTSWLVLVTTQSMIDDAAINKAVADLKAVASSSDGEYDGWDVLVDQS
jgi:hypothetical protein